MSVANIRLRANIEICVYLRECMQDRLYRDTPLFREDMGELCFISIVSDIVFYVNTGVNAWNISYFIVNDV